MPNPEILITGTNIVSDAAIAYIEGRNYTPRRIRRDDLTEDELIIALDGAAGYLIGGNEAPTDKVFEASGALRAAVFVGTDYQLYVPGWRRAGSLGVAVVSTPGANTRSVAEFTFLLMLSLSRAFASTVGSPARTGTTAGPMGRTLAGQRLGVVGLGRIGREVARIALDGFGMEVRYTAPRPVPDAEAELGIRRCTKLDILRWSDVVSLHRPGPGPGEAPELSGREFQVMRPGALLVNTVHPGLVDSTAARSKRIWRCSRRSNGKHRQSAGKPNWLGACWFGPRRRSETRADGGSPAAAVRSLSSPNGCRNLTRSGRRSW
ncbi:NAD(P)-dependent oxidoreductase [Streptomyces sp. NPDC001393]